MTTTDMPIRRAVADDAAELTEIAFASKGHWGYPEAYFEVWRDELTITPEFIEVNPVFTVCAPDNRLAGFASITLVDHDYWAGKTFVPAGYWLGHLFVRPAFLRLGLGSALMRRVKDYCREQGIPSLLISADPHAIGFYQAQGAVLERMVDSNIEGRRISIYRLDIK